MPQNAKTNSGEYWIDLPTPGELFSGQNCSSGGKCPTTARRVTVIVAGAVFLIPPGRQPDDEYGWGDAADLPAGTVIDQQHDGIGVSTTAVVVSQF